LASAFLSLKTNSLPNRKRGFFRASDRNLRNGDAG